jgi:predicted amidohydrolase YtcJ
MGSDWPVSSADPLEGIHVAVNRIAPNAEPGTPPLGESQRLPLAIALAAYTSGSAYASRLDQTNGSIEVGRPADLVVLDRDPFDGRPEEIAQARVSQTYVDGELVYEA